MLQENKVKKIHIGHPTSRLLSSNEGWNSGKANQAHKRQQELLRYFKMSIAVCIDGVVQQNNQFLKLRN